MKLKRKKQEIISQSSKQLLPRYHLQNQSQKLKNSHRKQKKKQELRLQQEEWAKAEIPEYPLYEQWDPAELGLDIPDDGKRNTVKLAEADELNDEGMDYNAYVSAKVMIPRDGHTFATGIVKRRARDDTGELIGKSNPNPFLDSSVYEVEFEDGAVERYHANIIAENIYSRIDGDGYSQYILDEILDHKSDDSAIGQENGFTVGRSGENLRSPSKPPEVGSS